MSHLNFDRQLQQIIDRCGNEVGAAVLEICNRLQKKFPRWHIEPPHYMEDREYGGGQVGWPHHWRVFAVREGAPSRFVQTAFADYDYRDNSEYGQGPVKCLENIALKIEKAEASWQQEM